MISRVIEVSFRGSSVALVRIDTAYFYNNGIIFKPTDIELPTSYQVHWADSPQASSTLETIGTAEGAPIPDDLWNRSRVIYGWIYLHPTEDSGVTGYEVRIYKNVRAGLPDGTEPTPAEQSTIDQLISALNSAVEQTGEDVESAEQAKDDAESARDNAQTYANNAQESAQASASSAESASQSASQASQSATASAQSASQSAQIKSDIEGMVDDAQSYAESALIASQASVTARNTAQGYAQSASASAQSASTSASASLTYANTASSKASEASTSAQTASQKATEASQSASQASGYAQTAESAKTDAQTAQGKAEDAQTAAETAQGLAEDAQEAAESAAASVQASAAQIAENTADIADLQTDVAQNEADILKAFPTDSASGAIASFSDGADNIPLKSLIVNIEPVQDLSNGDPSPENLCPISGWTEVDVEQSGVNVWDEEWEVGGINNQTGEPTSQTDRIRSKNFCSCLPSTSYYGYITGSISGFATYIWFYDANKEFVSGRSASKVVFTTPSNAYYFKISTYGGGYATYNHDISINYPSTDHSYHPYTGRSINIQLGQTVYGGKLDVLSGELVIDRAIVDIGAQSWIYTAVQRWFYNYRLGVKSNTRNAISSMYAYKSTPDIASDLTLDNVFTVNNTSVCIRNLAYTDATAFKAAMSGVQLCYELATPIEIQLSANQINSLLGVNNIWADSGDTEAEYRADTKLYIERLTVPDSADMIADANITSGKYFMVGNSLYKATANIASGSAVIVGTNATRKSLSEALNEINA